MTRRLKKTEEETGAEVKEEPAEKEKPKQEEDETEEQEKEKDMSDL